MPGKWVKSRTLNVRMDPTEWTCIVATRWVSCVYLPVTPRSSTSRCQVSKTSMLGGNRRNNRRRFSISAAARAWVIPSPFSMH